METIKCLLIDEWIKKMWYIYMASLVAQSIKNSPAKCWRCRYNTWIKKIPWRRAWQPTLVFLPGEYHGLKSLAGYSPWGRRVRHDWSYWARTMEYYSALRKKEILSFTTTWMKLEDIMLSEISQTHKRQTLHGLTYMRSQKNKKPTTNTKSWAYTNRE